MGDSSACRWWSDRPLFRLRSGPAAGPIIYAMDRVTNLRPNCAAKVSPSFFGQEISTIRGCLLYFTVLDLEI